MTNDAPHAVNPDAGGTPVVARHADRLRVLVVDDDYDVRMTMCDILENNGYRVDQAQNGNDALDRIRARRADLVVTDIMMPEKEGLETIRSLMAEFPATKIVAISGGGSTSNLDYLDMARRLGADKVLAKPVRSADLVSAITELFPR